MDGTGRRGFRKVKQKIQEREMGKERKTKLKMDKRKKTW